MIAVPSGQAADGREVGTSLQLGPVLQRYRAGDKAGAVYVFLQGVAGLDVAALDQVLPRAFASAVADADTFFGQQFRAVTQWPSSRTDARRITQPVLAVLVEESRRFLRSLPDGKNCSWIGCRMQSRSLPRANHLLHVQNPRGMAEALSSLHAIRSRRP